LEDAITLGRDVLPAAHRATASYQLGRNSSIEDAGPRGSHPDRPTTLQARSRTVGPRCTRMSTVDCRREIQMLYPTWHAKHCPHETLLCRSRILSASVYVFTLLPGRKMPWLKCRHRVFSMRSCNFSLKSRCAGLPWDYCADSLRRALAILHTVRRTSALHRMYPS
jgi:hypothetical protein